MVQEDKSKIAFQDGSSGSHLRFLISKILYTFDLQVILLLQCKFQLKSHNGSGADVKNLFSRWPFWISNQQGFSYLYIYWSACCSIISFDLIHRVVCKMSKTDFQDATVVAILDFPLAQF